MIKEIVNFMNKNEGIENYFIQNKVSNGYLHYYIKIKDDMICKDLLDVNNLDSELKEILKYMTYYQKGMHNKYLTKDYGLGGSSPYILTVIVNYDGNCFKTNIQDTKKKKKSKKMIFNKKNYRKYFIEQDSNALECFNRIEQHFLQAREYLENKVDVYSLSKIRIFLFKNLEKYLLNNNEIKKEAIKKYDNQKKEKKEVSIEIRVYIDVGLDIVKSFYEKFVEKRAFLDTKKAGLHKGKCSLCNKESNELSLPYVLSTLGDDMGMKLSMPLNLTNYVCKTCTLKLHKFKVMTDNQQLTKPFPLFIKNESLFGKQISILKDNEKKKNYREIIKSIYYSNPKDLKNFYLLNYFSKSDNGWKLQIKDLDYVENFQYITSIKVENFIDVKNSFYLNDFYDKELSVFQFEKIVNELIFEDKLQNNYFSDYKKIEVKYTKINSSNSNSILKNYLLKYRQAFYDFIYKSHQSALELIDFREMLLDIIIDNIRHDDKNNEGYSIYENEIKEKLNLLFSLNQNEEIKVDSGEFVEIQKKMKNSLGYWEKVKNRNNQIKNEFIGGVDYIEVKNENDRFFAFLCGQLARFLLGKSKAKKENITHANFSSFTEWQDSKLLKSHIQEVLSKYAHELQYNKKNGKLENAMSIIMTYRDDLKMDDVMEYMIAGYFSDNQIEYQNNNIGEDENE